MPITRVTIDGQVTLHNRCIAHGKARAAYASAAMTGRSDRPQPRHIDRGPTKPNVLPKPQPRLLDRGQAKPKMPPKQTAKEVAVFCQRRPWDTRCKQPKAALPATKGAAHSRSPSLMAWTGALGQNCLKRPPALARDADAVLDARVAVVMPVHPPKFGFVKRFVASVDRCAQHLHFRHYLVFASIAEKEQLMASDLASARVALPLVVCLPAPCVYGANGKVCAPAWKKLFGLSAVFSGRPHAVYHEMALALDADSEYQSRLPFRGWFSRWGANEQVVGYRRANNSVPRQTRASCAAVHLVPPLPFFFHWADAPLYERKDFGDFLERFDWELAFRGELQGYIFDHISYLCYKLRVANWSVLDAGYVKMEMASTAQQDSFESTNNYSSSFLWSRENHPNRLLLYHRDRGCIGTGQCRSPKSDCAHDSQNIIHSQHPVAKAVK